MTDTEFEITADLVCAACRKRSQPRRAGHLRSSGRWGNQMWRLGDELAVRMQRMEPTPELQLKERRRPVPAPRLPPRVPTPVRFGGTVRALPQALDRDGVGSRRAAGPRLDLPRRHAADRLAGFLRVLHVEAPAEASIATDRGAHPRNCTDGFEDFFQAVAPDGIAADVRLSGMMPLRPRVAGPAGWAHGDSTANVVVWDGTLSGIVDFGDMFAWSSAWDLAAAWILLPAGTASRFFEHVRACRRGGDPRARGLAAMKSLFLMLMGQNGDRVFRGKPNWGPLGRTAPDRVLKGLDARSFELVLDLAVIEARSRVGSRRSRAPRTRSRAARSST